MDPNASLWHAIKLIIDHVWEHPESGTNSITAPPMWAEVRARFSFHSMPVEIHTHGQCLAVVSGYPETSEQMRYHVSRHLFSNGPMLEEVKRVLSVHLQIFYALRAIAD